jgi:branched-chain amino acid transport system substrate-binding protein
MPLAASANGSGSARAAASKKAPIVIGTIAALSGAKVVTPPTTLAPTLKAWVKSVNATGGIKGHKIKLIIKDDQADSAKALAALQDLISQHVVALVGVLDPGVEATWKSAIDAAKIPVIGVPNSIFWDTDPNYFPVGTTIAAGTLGAAIVAKGAGGSKYGYAYCAELAVCKQAIPLVEAAAKNAGMGYGTSVAVSSSSADLTAPCLELRNAGVDALVAGVANPIMLSQQCATQGYKPILVASEAVWSAPGILTNQFTNNRLWTNSREFPPFANAPQVRAFKKTLAKYGRGIKPDFNTTNAWTSGLLFAKAAKAVKGKVTSAKLIAVMRKMKHETLGGLTPGPLNFTDPNYHPTSCFYTIRVKNGKLVAVNNLKYRCIKQSVLKPLVTSSQ